MAPEKLVLGIEGTAHTAGVGVFGSKRGILANEYYSFVPPEGVGLIPADLARSHCAKFPELIANALANSKVDARDITGVAFSQGPGMVSPLQVTATAARTLSQALNIPLVGVNHLVAHLEIARHLTGMKDPIYVLVSGGSTQIITRYQDRYVVMGETLDIAIGNCYDKFARLAGMYHPELSWGGPLIDQMAAKGENYIPLPYAVKGMDVSFSGILTFLKEKLAQGVSIEDLCFSLQETALAMVVEVAERAMAHMERGAAVLTGGFANCGRLQEMFELMTSERGAEFGVVSGKNASDNGAMIACAGLFKLEKGVETPLAESGVNPSWRLDSEKVWG